MNERVTDRVANNMTKRVLSVGQCHADHVSINRMLESVIDCQVDSVQTWSEVERALDQDSVDLVLVNRILDSTGESGIEYIRKLKADSRTQHIPIMLVSNIPEAQVEAVGLGAESGFGKSSLNDPETEAKIRTALSNQ